MRRDMLSSMISGNLKPLARLSAVALALVLLAGCGSSGPDEPAKDKPAVAKTTEASTGITAEQLAKALPADDFFPKGADIRVRCPGDPECDDKATQTQDASISLAPPLPAGVKDDGSAFDDDAKFRVAGGEWSENLWLRAWVYDEAAEARGYLVDFQKDASKRVGDLDVPAKKTDSGYDYGFRGKGSFDKITIGDWRGFVRVLDVEFIHLDGRVTDRRFDVFSVMQKDNALVRVDSSFTVQGRDKADAVGTVKDLLDDYLGQL